MIGIVTIDQAGKYFFYAIVRDGKAATGRKK
jgi:hypothetical protein